MAMRTRRCAWRVPEPASDRLGDGRSAEPTGRDLKAGTGIRSIARPMSATRKRSGQPFAVTFTESAALAGAAVGLLIVASNGHHHHVAAQPCPSARAAGTCIAQAATNALMPYLIGGIAGLVIGGALAVLLVLAWRAIPSLAVGRGAAAISPAGALAATSSTAAQPAKPRREPIPERLRHDVWRRDRGMCVDCGSRERLEFDHIIPVSRGGSNTARNLELRCESCNRRKGSRI